MAIINQEEIKGYHFPNELVCTDCIEDAEMVDAKYDEILILTELERDENIYFCDRCKGRLI